MATAPKRSLKGPFWDAPTSKWIVVVEVDGKPQRHEFEQRAKAQLAADALRLQLGIIRRKKHKAYDGSDEWWVTMIAKNAREVDTDPRPENIRRLQAIAQAANAARHWKRFEEMEARVAVLEERADKDLKGRRGAKGFAAATGGGPRTPTLPS